MLCCATSSVRTMLSSSSSSSSIVFRLLGKAWTRLPNYTRGKIAYLIQYLLAYHDFLLRDRVCPRSGDSQTIFHSAKPSLSIAASPLRRLLLTMGLHVCRWISSVLEHMSWHSKRRNCPQLTCDSRRLMPFITTHPPLSTSHSPLSFNVQLGVQENDPS